MKIIVSRDPVEMGQTAGANAAAVIRRALDTREEANIILATGTSQFETLNQLIAEPGIDWGRVVMFHLDEYIGLSASHPASFRRYLTDRFLARVPSLRAAHLVNGEGDPQTECERLGLLIENHPIDIALVGIGENCHLAFNDPPADFDTSAPYIVVSLDDQCVQQQYGEGWFASLDEVPRQAISMSIRQIMKASNIVCSVPDGRKAQAVKNAVENTVSPQYPASILQRHPQCTLYLDVHSAALLSPERITSD